MGFLGQDYSWEDVAMKQDFSYNQRFVTMESYKALEEELAEARKTKHCSECKCLVCYTQVERDRDDAWEHARTHDFRYQSGG